MPRMSIYLPDELAARLKAAETSGTASQVIQDALRRFLGDSDPSWTQAPPDAAALLAAATADLNAQAGKQFQAGYLAALARLPDLDWSTLDNFAQAGFDLTNWLTPWRNGVHDEATRDAPKSRATPVAEQPGEGRDVRMSWFWALAEDLGSTVDPIGFDRFSWRQTKAFERGYSAGLKAAYEVVDRGTLPSEAPAPPPHP